MQTTTLSRRVHNTMVPIYLCTGPFSNVKPTFVHFSSTKAYNRGSTNGFLIVGNLHHVITISNTPTYRIEINSGYLNLERLSRRVRSIPKRVDNDKLRLGSSSRNGGATEHLDRCMSRPVTLVTHASHSCSRQPRSTIKLVNMLQWPEYYLKATMHGF